MKFYDQSGSTKRTVIIAVASVIVLGIIGFFVWQGLSQKPVAKVAADQNSQQANSSLPPIDAGAKSVVVTEWGIKGSYSGDQTFTYQLLSTDSNALVLKKGNSLACANGIGSVYRLKSDEKSSLFGTSGKARTAEEIYLSRELGYQAHVGDYYYFIKDPTTACSNDTVSEVDRAALVQALKDFTLSIKTNS